MTTCNNDIKLYCNIRNNNYIIKLNNYSKNLTKSSYEFNSKEVFSINNTIIEGVITENSKDDVFNTLSFYTYFNCKKNGKFLKYKSKSIHNNINYYYENNKYIVEGGIKVIECNYLEKLLFGRYQSWYDNGKKEKDIFFKIIDKNNINHGKYEVRYSNGNKKQSCYYNNGTLEGRYELWYKKGIKQIECYYSKGELIGKPKEWDENGDLYNIK
jgi:antitoxin component YwqK of YwqJK toxin-antitoxin module